MFFLKKNPNIEIIVVKSSVFSKKLEEIIGFQNSLKVGITLVCNQTHRKGKKYSH